MAKKSGAEKCVVGKLWVTPTSDDIFCHFIFLPFSWLRQKAALGVTYVSSVAHDTCQRSSCSLFDERIHPLPGVFELAQLDQFVPDGSRVLVWGHNGHNSPVRSAAHRAHANFRFGVKPRQFEPLLERLERQLELG